MSAVQALLILLVIFAIGEVIADKTKALLSTTLVVAVILLIGFWIGLPVDIMDTAMISGIAGVLIGLLITCLGTMIDIPELKRQWKTVVIGFVCVVSSVAVIILVAPLFMNRDMAVAGAPIFAGANIATLIMTKALEEKGLTEIGTFCILMLVTQNFFGIPVASILLRKEAKAFVASPENISMYAAKEEKVEEGKSKRKLLQLPKLLQKPSVMLAKIAIVAALSQFLSELTNGTLHYFVIALLMGVLFTELGFLEKNILDKTASSGFIIFATTIIIFTSLSKTTPGQMVSLLGPLVLCLGLGIATTILVGAILGKLLKVSPYLAICLGLTCTFGFPTTLLMPKEVASAMGRSLEEKSAIENYLLPKMITAGFVTVTIVSVIVAGVVAQML